MTDLEDSTHRAEAPAERLVRGVWPLPTSADPAPRWEPRMSTPQRRCWLTVMLLSSGVFTAIAAGWTTGQVLTDIDSRWALRLLAHGPPWWTEAMRVLTRLHGVAGISVAVGVWVGLLLWRRQIVHAAVVGLVVYGGLLLNGGLKLVFQRARPVFADGVDPPLPMLSTYSFPSGHASGSTVFYGVVLLTLFSRTASSLWRLAAALIACTMVVLVAYSRVYVGAHFLSDVVAAVAEGLAWVALCVLLLEWRRACGPQASTSSR